jgi:hypothetical protein
LSDNSNAIGLSVTLPRHNLSQGNGRLLKIDQGFMDLPAGSFANAAWSGRSHGEYIINRRNSAGNAPAAPVPVDLRSADTPGMVEAL